MSDVYYNENDPAAAEWLRALMFGGAIPFGRVDTRSISDVRPSDLAGYAQCHFFAGVGGWSRALQLAGVASDRPLWTGSCPCQPFSPAGKRGGRSDERHLWPHWFHLIDVCRPPVVLGEQVASKDGLDWLDLVSADMEGAGYAFAAADMCAAGVGAPHIRQRLWFVGMAEADSARLQGRGVCGDGARERPLGSGGMARGMENTELPEGERYRPHGGQDLREQEAMRLAGRSVVGGVVRDASDARMLHGMGDADGDGRSRRSNATNGFWGDADWLGCKDGKWRPVEPGTSPLAHGVPGRVGLLRGYGNAIVSQVGATFIEACGI